MSVRPFLIFRVPSENWKNEDEIDESPKSQLNFEYDVHLLNYTIKIKKHQKPKLGFLGF